MPTGTNDSILARVQEVIAKKTGYDPTDLKLEANLTEDLQFTQIDFLAVMKGLNQEFETDLNAKELFEEIETIAELVERIEDETELG